MPIFKVVYSITYREGYGWQSAVHGGPMQSAAHVLMGSLVRRLSSHSNQQQWAGCNHALHKESSWMAFGNCCHSKTIAVSGAETYDSGTHPAVALHDNRTVISVLKTDNPLLSGLYYHVGCSQYYMTMELAHQSHSPMMERCCKLMHQMIYCASWLCCNTGIMPSWNKSISWNDQAHKYSVGHHLRLPWMMVGCHWSSQDQQWFGASNLVLLRFPEDLIM